MAPECYLVPQSLSNSWLRWIAGCIDRQHAPVNMDFGVAALAVGCWKMSRRFELPSACLPARVMKAIINRWGRSAVSEDGRARSCIAGQFREDVLRFRFHNNAGISIALDSCQEHDNDFCVHRWKKYCQVSIEPKFLCPEVLSKPPTPTL
jgi:hypothetical protein